jgi:sulfatase maturation enzyme AslB (radical SAM superfamily)
MARVSVVWITSLGLCLTLVSCEDKNPAQQYGNTMVDSLKTTKKVEKKVNVLEVQKSIQEYYAANGRYPSDLNEIAAFNGIVLESDNYSYNPESGTLTEIKP